MRALRTRNKSVVESADPHLLVPYSEDEAEQVVERRPESAWEQTRYRGGNMWIRRERADSLD